MPCNVHRPSNEYRGPSIDSKPKTLNSRSNATRDSLHVYLDENRIRTTWTQRTYWLSV